LAEALERLEQERERRVAAKVEAGQAIVVPLLATATQDLKTRQAAKAAAMRAAGEKRELIFDTFVVNTGVPQGDGILASPAPPPFSRYEAPPPEREPPRPVAPKPDTQEAKRIMATIPPRSEADCGFMFEGGYTVSGGQVHVSDADGRPLGSLPVAPGDNVELIARRLLREKMVGNSDFFGPLPYPESLH